MDAQQIRAAAIARVKARWVPVEYETVQVGGRDARVQKTGTGKFGDPGPASEWWDDRIARTSPDCGPWTSEMWQLAEAAKDGAAAARTAVRAFRPLPLWNQWHARNALASWKNENTRHDVSQVISAIEDEWENLELTEQQPVAERMEPVNPQREAVESPKVRKYRSKYGQPAGMAV